MTQAISRRSTLPVQFAFCALSLVTSFASAGQFRCTSYTELKQPCGDMIRGVITDEFTKKYPVSKFEIAIISSSTRYDDGASSGVAVAGLVPVNSGRVPASRFNAHFIDRGSRNVAAIEADEKDAILRAVANMVADSFPVKQAAPAQASNLYVKTCRTVTVDEITSVVNQVCTYDSSGPTCHDEHSPGMRPVSRQVCD